MRAISIHPKKKKVALIDHVMPEIETDTQVKVRSLEVGICGTDREICTFVYGSPPPGKDYLVLGHESLGEVVETGRRVSKLKQGDLVAPTVRRPCRSDACMPCQENLQDFCVNGGFTERGIKEEHGFMTEYYVEDEQYLHLVPPNLREVAVLIEPLTIAEKALAQVRKVQGRLPWGSTLADDEKSGEGLTAVVLGAGPVGILGAMALKARGFNTIVYSRSKAPNIKSNVVEAFGVPYYSALDISPDQLAEKTGSIDLVYEAVGVPEFAFSVMAHLGINGVFVFTGIPAPTDPVPIHAHQLMRDIVLKNQLILGTVNADPASFEAAIRDLSRFQKLWPEALKGIITQRWRPEDYEELLLGKATGIKNVISFEI